MIMSRAFFRFKCINWKIEYEMNKHLMNHLEKDFNFVWFSIRDHQLSWIRIGMCITFCICQNCIPVLTFEAHSHQPNAESMECCVNTIVGIASGKLRIPHLLLSNKCTWIRFAFFAVLCSYFLNSIVGPNKQK